MPNFQIAYKAADKKAVVQLSGDTLPTGYTNIGTFTDASADTLGSDDKVAFHYARDELFLEGVQDMRGITLHIAPQSIDVTPATASLAVNGTRQLSATFTPKNVHGVDTVNWTTSNAAIATVDANGLVTAKAIGTATITGTTAFSGKTDTCVVTVA